MSKLPAILAIAFAITLPTLQEFKPFDQKGETNATKKTIEAKYKILSEAIYKRDYEAADSILDEDLYLYISISGKYDDDSIQDEGSYLTDIEGGEPIASVVEGNIPADTKIERKLTDFIAGRRLSTAHYTEKSTGGFIDEEGLYGDKGKSAKVETEVVFTDVWLLTVSGESETPDWYLNAREVTSFSFKVNGKQIEVGDRQSAHLPKLR